MSHLLTKNPVAIRQLMNEAIFSLPSESSIVGEEDSPAVISSASLPTEIENPFVFWGGNRRHILFFVRHPFFDYFSEEAEEAFFKTLGALKLSLEEVAVVNLNKTSKTFDEIKELLQPKYCIYCEGETAESSSSFNVFMKSELNTLYTYSFEEMLRDTTKKRLFWNAIQEIKQ